MTNAAFISIKNVSFNYEGAQNSGVKLINLDIEKGSIVSIIGESGSGKSTLLKLMYGLISPQEGLVTFKDVKVAGPHEKLLPGHDQMKMAEQSFNLNTYAKVYENISSLLPNTDLDFKKDKTQQVMELLGINHLWNKRVADLSGGEQQRVALSRSLITEPEVLLLDEPFSQLDTLLRTQLRADIKKLAVNLGITIIIVSHDPIDGLALADKLVVLKEGSIIETGEPQEIYEHPATSYTACLIGDAVVLSNDEAKRAGFKCLKSKLLFYPQWAIISNSWAGNKFTIRDVSFKGLFTELLLERNDVFIRIAVFKMGFYKINQTVNVSLKKTLEFD